MLALSVSSISFGQALFEKSAFDFSNIEVKFSDTKFTGTSDKIGTILWSDNFDTASLWVLDNSAGPGGAAFGWTVDATNDGWWSATGITSTSGGNFAELSNGDPTSGGGTQAQNVTYTLTTANPIDIIALGGSDQVSLEFEQYGARFNDLQEIQISTDGTNFTTVGDNLGFSVLSATGGSAYPNPDLKIINLAPFLTTTTATSVWIRFSWTTNFPTSTSANVWITYGWYIDDLKIRNNPEHDLSASREFYGFLGVPYTRIPVAHLQPMDFSMVATNEGTIDQTNTVLTASINGSVVAVSNDTTVLVGTSDTLNTAQYTPTPTVGLAQTITLSIDADSTDEIPANNTATFPPYEFSNYLYALDDFGTPGNGGGDNNVSPGAFEFEAGNFFDAVIDDTVRAIEVVVGPNTVAGTVIDGVLYELDGTGTFVEIARSGFYTTTAADAGNMVSLPLVDGNGSFTGAMVAGSNYFGAVHAFTEFFYGTSGNSPDNDSPSGTQSLIFYPNMTAPSAGENFFTRNTPMVRLNLDPNYVTGIEELNEKISFSVSPNPSRDLFNIKLDAKVTENVNLSVRNIVGQTVLTKTLSVSGQTRETISLANYDKGIYFLTIDNNEEKKTIKLIVK